MLPREGFRSAVLRGCMAVAAGCALAAPLAAQRVELTSDAAAIEIGGRVHTQLNTSTVQGQPDSELFLRRARFGLKVRAGERVEGELQVDFADNELSLKDAYLSLALAPGLEILAGNAKIPFSLLELTSSNEILPIEREVEIRGLDAFAESGLVEGLGYAERDVGLQVVGEPEGAPLGLEYAAGVFAGPAHGEAGTRDSYQYAARVSVAPLPRTRVGGGWSSRSFAREDDSGFALRRGHAWEIDVEYGSFAPGLHLLGEVARGDFDPFSGARFTGAQLWAGYRSRPLGRLFAVEPIFRASRGDVAGADEAVAREAGTLLTPGLNLYLSELNRLMVNYDVWIRRDRAGRERSFKLQTQLAF